MHSFYTVDELKNLGFERIGKNVLISRKASVYGADKITIGDNVRIDDFCILSGRIVLGNHIHIAAYAALYGADAGIHMEDFSGISSRVSVYATSDDYSGKAMTNPTVPDEYRNVQSTPVIIEKHVIVGASSVVLPGVILREGSAFGALTLINKSSEPWSVNVGVPARRVGDRRREILQLEQKFLDNMDSRR